MIKKIFSNHMRFALLYFTMLIVDVLVKLNLPAFPFRLISKPILLLLLFGCFYFNRKGDNKKKHLWMFLALASFFIGDLLIINHANIIFLSASLFFFSIGKVFFCMKFSHKKDFKVSRLIPFTIILFCYVISLVGFIYKDLGAFLIPALTSFFVTLLMFQFSYLRKEVFNKKSYVNVLFGVFLYTFSEGLMAIKTFKFDIPFQDFTIITFYGAAMYFIVYGTVSETEEELQLEEKYSQEIKLF